MELRIRFCYSGTMHKNPPSILLGGFLCLNLLLERKFVAGTLLCGSVAFRRIGATRVRFDGTDSRIFSLLRHMRIVLYIFDLLFLADRRFWSVGFVFIAATGNEREQA